MYIKNNSEVPLNEAVGYKSSITKWGETAKKAVALTVPS